MSILEAIIYGIVGGMTELLPISFAGHETVLRDVFGMASLTQAGGYYIRVMLCLGVIVAICMAFSAESRTLGNAIGAVTGLKRVRRADQPDASMYRSILLGVFALIPMLLSLIFTARAERISRLPYLAVLFALSGLLLYFGCRKSAGKKTEKEVLLPDTLLIGIARMLSVFPGLSSIGSSVAVGNARGLATHYNLRLGYLLTLVFELAALIYHLIRAFAYGSMTASLLLPMLLALVCSAAFGYLAIQYVRYLINHGKFHFFAYYCWDAAAIVLILSLINF